MKVCPNTSSKEWKVMMGHLNENEAEAYRAYIAHGYTIPPVISLTELKQAVGLTSGRYSVTQQIKVNKKIRIYNMQNGTSHFVQWSPYGTGELSTAELRFNYMPVNKERQVDRDRRRKMIGYGLLQDVESFENVYTPSESEQEAGRFVEGDFLPPDYFPATEVKRTGPKFRALITSKEADRKVLYQDRDKLYLANKNASTVEKKAEIATKIARVNKAIEKVEDDIAKLLTLDSLDQIEAYAEEDMRTLEKIFSKSNPTRQDLLIARRIIHVWDEAGNFDGTKPHIFYDPDEYMARDKGLKDITDKFEGWRKRAIAYNTRLFDLEEKFTERDTKTTFSGVDSINFQEPLPDMSAFWTNVLDISEVDDVRFQVIHAWVKEANFAAHREFMVIKERIEELVKATGLSNFNIFQQTFSNEDENKTGDLVHRFTQEFLDWEKNIKRERDRAKKHIDTNIAGYVKANIAFIEKLRENTETIDARIFFHDPEFTHYPAPTEEQKAKEKERLVKLLGEKGFQEYYDLAQKQVEEYKIQEKAQRSFYEAEMEESADELISAWIVSNSPYYYADLMQKGYDLVTYNDKHSYPTMRFVRPLPKQEKHFDNKFKRIEQNKDYLELYNYMTELLHDLKLYFPNQKVSFMEMNTIPFLSKKVSEIFSDEGVGAAMSAVKDEIKKSLRTEDLSTIGTPEDQKELQVQMIHNNQGRINDYILLMDTQYRAEHDEGPDPETVEKWRRQIISQIAEEKSFDLDRVLKAYASAALTYKHKAMIEDQIVIMQDILERAMERKQNAAGEQQFDKDGNRLAKKGLENLRKMMESYLDVVYWGYPSNKPEGKMKGRILTDDEKEAKLVLEKSQEDLDKLLADGKIDMLEYDYRKNVIDDQLANLGGVKTLSKYGDLVLQYIQMKGMGWNLFAAFANLGFGFISNVIEASDGRNYSPNSFWKAQAMVMNSLPGVNKLTPNGNKVRELMYYFDVLKQAKNELYETSSTRLFKRIGDKLDWANPYAPQSRTEYMNQAPVMIAMMMDQKVKRVVNGKEEEISMWEAFDTDGKLIEGVSLSDKELTQFKIRVDKLVKMNHGNYDPDSAIKFKRIWFGRAISQFRTWAYQGFAERFKGEFKDFQLKNQLTEADFVVRKGRYLSYGAYWSYMQQENGWMGMGAVFNGTYQLLRKLVGAHTTFDDMVKKGGRFTEVDAANMRKNMTEIALYLFITAFILLLKNVDADDDDDKAIKMARTFLINQMGRLGTDIMFYSNPIEFERLFRNAIPAFTLVTDAAKFIDSAWALIIEGEDKLQSGPNKGESRTWRDFKKLVPLATQIQKLQSSGEQVYKK